jgi:hypothetical protein
MPEGSDAGRYLQIVLGGLFVAFLGFQGWLAVSINSINDRLTRIEATMEENKAERQRQVSELDRRLTRVEDR